MKKLLALILVLGMVPIAAGEITLEVYEGDGETPFDGNDVMVGTKLTIIISSDCNDYWSGGLFIAGQDRAFGTLAGRDYDPNRIMYDPNRSLHGITQFIRDWTGSHYEDAGELARVTAWKDSSIWGFDLYTSDIHDSNVVAGDWFVIDYEADEVGECNVVFYDYSISWDDPNCYITFRHVPTRDLNSDEVVDFGDFAIFASQWSGTGCQDPNWCTGADLDRDGDVDHNDLGLFTEYWLWPTLPDVPNEPNNPLDPTYSIVDVNGSSEITIDVNDTITLYVRMETNDVNVFVFDLEVNISDTNLGSIDNTAYPGGTAQILATPRDSFFDYWGPGLEQEEGIQLFGASISSISDGNLASFVFTCKGQGDVTLQLIDWHNPGMSKLESILIHQSEIGGMGMGGTLKMQETQQSQSTQTIDIDELVKFLEEIWLQEEEIRETHSEKEWNEFIDSVKNPYPQFQ